MARPRSTSLPFWMVLILVVCLFSLAAHFFTEQAGISRLFSAASEIDGHGDVLFIAIFLALIPVVGLLVKLIVETAISKSSLSLSPVLPPPNK